MAYTRLKRTVKHLLPPILFKRLRRAQYLFHKPILEYAPQGWQTELKKNGRNTGWSVDSVVSAEKSKWAAFCRNLEGAGPLGFSHEHDDPSIVRDPRFHNVHITYAYVLALAAHNKGTVSVLDWGGGLGHYYQIGKAVMPEINIDFHVKEVPLMAEAGRQLNPEVHWYDDETCLERDYDLVMMTGSIPYMKGWADALRRITRSVKKYLFLFRLPVVQHGPTFVAIQRIYNSRVLHQQLNQSELLDTVEDTGLSLMRELIVGDRPYIKGAPEQCELRAWLFKRGTT